MFRQTRLTGSQLGIRNTRVPQHVYLSKWAGSCIASSSHDLCRYCIYVVSATRPLQLEIQLSHIHFLAHHILLKLLLFIKSSSSLYSFIKQASRLPNQVFPTHPLLHTFKSCPNSKNTKAQSTYGTMSLLSPSPSHSPYYSHS
jgi:hypothetical protein